MFLIDYFFNFLYWFGFDFRKQGQMLFLGLDNAGKTTLLRLLKSQKMGFHLDVEELEIENTLVRAIDLGGHEMARRIWDQYMIESVTAVVYLVDVSDPDRFSLSRRELHRVMQSLPKTPILILGNKIDKGAQVSEDSLRSVLEITDECTGKNTTPNSRPMEVFMCSIREQSGYGDGFRWIAQFL